MQLYIGNKNYSSWSLRAVAADDAGRHRVRGAAAAPRLGRRLAVQDDAARARADRAGCRCWSTTASRSGTSLAIIEYLAEAFPSKQLWPRRPPAARAGAQPLRRDAFGLRARCATAVR